MFFTGCSAFFKTGKAKRQNGSINKNQFIPGDSCSNGIKRNDSVSRPPKPPSQTTPIEQGCEHNYQVLSKGSYNNVRFYCSKCLNIRSIQL